MEVRPQHGQIPDLTIGLYVQKQHQLKTMVMDSLYLMGIVVIIRLVDVKTEHYLLLPKIRTVIQVHHQHIVLEMLSNSDK